MLALLARLHRTFAVRLRTSRRARDLVVGEPVDGGEHAGEHLGVEASEQQLRGCMNVKGFFSRLRGRRRARLTSVTTPIFGLGWEYGTSEREAIQGLFSYLESRRALWIPFNSEDHERVVRSILDMRDRITTVQQHFYMRALPHRHPRSLMNLGGQEQGPNCPRFLRER